MSKKDTSKEIKEKLEEIEKEESKDQDISFEEDIEYEEEEGGKPLDKIKKLKEEIKRLKKEKEEYLSGWQKERADFVNYKKGESERSELISLLFKENILSRFLSVIDSFNMAFANKEAWEKVDASWRNGVEYIYTQMNTIFEEYGVVRVGKEGEEFNPSIHESVEVVDTKEKKNDHKIAKVIQFGYRMNSLSGSDEGKVLRPAKVHVFKHLG